LKKQLESLNVTDRLSGNGVDELPYLFLASQVELVESLDQVREVTYSNELDWLAVGIVNADGEKCDRCWNYSNRVGQFSSDPTICERCHAALAGEF
jgi:isoleucyl-tRNA synthetase